MRCNSNDEQSLKSEYGWIIHGPTNDHVGGVFVF